MVALSLAAVGLATATFIGRVAAQLDRSFARAGAGALSALEGRDVDSRWLVINGVRVSLHTGAVDEPFGEALERRAKDCLPRDGSSSADSVLLSALSVRKGVFEDAGYVACVELGAQARSLDTFTEAAKRFANNWDVAELGRLRYVYATRAEEDPESRSLLFSVQSDGPLDLRRMLGRGLSDAEGTDPPDVPRLPGARRILSVHEADRPSGVVAYRTDASSGEVVDFFREELRRAGWAVHVGGEGEPVEVDGHHLIMATKGSTQVTVSYPSTFSGSDTLLVLWSGERR